MVQNIESTRLLVERVGALDENLRMVRLSSDILPVYTQSVWGGYWRDPSVRAYCERGFGAVGDLARKSGVRLSFHPGQFTVLASENPGIVDRSIEEFEYHADMARWMGYGKSFQDLKINVHISGKQGPAGIRSAYKRLSPEARNCITIENEENSWGLDDCLTISDLVPIVLDVHHHWIKTGDYISPMDPRVDRVVQSWRGVRPTMHYSVSREDYLVDHDTSVSPDYAQLLEDGYKKQKMRAHSDFYWNTPVNEWALSFLKTHDIMCEAKGKNLASFALADQARKLGLL
jgi:UV DNA damage repair endonuclease